MVSMLVVTLAALASEATGEWNVRDYGAVADGQTDCTASFQRALDAAGSAGGGVVHVPAGLIDMSGPFLEIGALLLEKHFPDIRIGESPAAPPPECPRTPTRSA